MSHRVRSSQSPTLRLATAIVLILALLCAEFALPLRALAQDDPAVPPAPAEVSPEVSPIETPAGEPATGPAATGAVDAPEPPPAPDATTLGPSVPDVIPSMVQPAADDAALGQTVKIIASKDAFISSAQPNLNTGGLGDLDAGWYGAYGAVRPLVKFNVNAIPPKAKIYSATLVMYLNMAVPGNDGGMTLNGAPMRSDWSENGVTWANAASAGGTQFHLGSVGAGAGWVSFSLVNNTQSWVNGNANYGIVIIGNETPTQPRARIFSSRHVPGREPYLLVNYECDNVAPKSKMNPLPQWSQGSFTVSWSGQDFAPTNCKPSGINKYNVDYQVNGGAWTRWKSTSATSATFKDLAPNGATVNFRVFAVDNAGNTEATPTVVQAATRVDSVPPVVTFTQLPQYTTTPNFQVNWSGADDLSGVASFDIQYQVDGGNYANLVANTTTTSFTYSNAQSEKVYGFRGRARDRAGNVSAFPPDPQTRTTVVLAPVAKMQPISPIVINSSSAVTTTIPLAWTSFTAPGTSITSYQMYYRFYDANNSTAGWLQWRADIPGTQTSIAFPWTTLVPGNEGRFEFEVTATNNLGQTTPRTGTPEASVLVDLQDLVKPVAFLPILADQ